MAAPKKYFTEEEKAQAKRESYKRYRESEHGKKVRKSYYHRMKSDPEYMSKRKKHAEKYKKKNKERLLENGRKANKARRDKNPEVYMVYEARKRAKVKGIQCTITPQDIFIPKTCPVLGIPLEAGTGKRYAGSPSLDRVDNNKGYTLDNIKVISHRANALKNDATIEELKAIVKYMEDS